MSNEVESPKKVDQHVSIKADKIVNKDANVNDSNVIANDVSVRNEPDVTVHRDTNAQRNVKYVSGHNEVQHNGMSREKRSTRNRMPGKFKDFVGESCTAQVYEKSGLSCVYSNVDGILNKKEEFKVLLRKSVLP